MSISRHSLVLYTIREMLLPYYLTIIYNTGYPLIVLPESEIGLPDDITNKNVTCIYTEKNIDSHLSSLDSSDAALHKYIVSILTHHHRAVGREATKTASIT